jgi:DNA-binding transcriptional ArsR family regulator
MSAFSIFNLMVKYRESVLDATFGALSDPTRRAILARLSKGEAQVTELAEPFGISLPAVSKHLRVLEQANLITRRVDGRVHRFVVNPEPMHEAVSWVEHYQRFWQQQLQSLDRYLKQTINKEEKHDAGRSKRRRSR